MSTADRLLEGAVDIHVHYAPDPFKERRADAVQVARAAKEAGMRGLVFKSHEFSSQPIAYIVNRVVPDIAVMGGVVLNTHVGGLNPLAVEVTARMGGRVVWMPTFTSRANRAAEHQEGGISLVDARGHLRPEVFTILELVKQYDMVLATGHVSTQETMLLVDEACNMGINRIVVTHGTSLTKLTGLSVEDMKTLAQKGAFIEHCILSTDFGQDMHPMPAEGLRMGIAMLLQTGLDEVEVGMAVKDTPSRLLGL